MSVDFNGIQMHPEIKSVVHLAQAQPRGERYIHAIYRHLLKAVLLFVHVIEEISTILQLRHQPFLLAPNLDQQKLDYTSLI